MKSRLYREYYIITSIKVEFPRARNIELTHKNSATKEISVCPNFVTQSSCSLHVISQYHSMLIFSHIDTKTR